MNTTLPAPSRAMVELLFAPMLPRRHKPREAAIRKLAARFDAELWELLRASRANGRIFDRNLKNFASAVLV